MFDVGSSELLMIAIVAIVVIGPKDLPRALYKLGQIVSKARGMTRHFRSGIDAMVREVEMEELQKKWAEENRRIMEAHPHADPYVPEEEEGRTDVPAAEMVDEAVAVATPDAAARSPQLPFGNDTDESQKHA